VFGRRAALAALDGAAPTTEPPDPPTAPVEGPPRPSRETRAALWRDAGLVRSAEGLAELLGDPHPLARLIGASALAREESRGAHFRSDRPDTDAALDLHHVVAERDEQPAPQRWE
jgi:L-aspartate oxidase